MVAYQRRSKTVSCDLGKQMFLKTGSKSVSLNAFGQASFLLICCLIGGKQLFKNLSS